MMTYQEAVDYIEETPKFTKKNSLDHTRAFLKRLGSPESRMKILHVAGTNGKGSVCSFLASMLHAAGKRTGLFTSPHLVDINERFVIDEEQVSDEAFLKAFHKVMDCVGVMKEEGYPHPTYFELLFLVGMVIFKEAGVEYLVLETGLGGRLDATNSVAHPVVTVLTSISLDHTEYLGHTVAAIAGEKAGIIKEGCPVVYDGTRKDVEEVILKKASEMHAKAYAIRPDMYKILMNTQKTIDFSMDTGYYEPMNVSIDTVAEYQVMNACEAVTAALVMDEGLTETDIHSGMKNMRWEGRMEPVLPGVILDGAHNDSGIEEFVKTARRLGKDTKVTLLFSCVSDKDYDGMIRTICEEIPFTEVIVTEVGAYRMVPAEKLGSIFRKYTKQPITEISSVEEAFDEAYGRKGDGILFCVGSLYLVGSLKEILRSRKNA